MRLIVCLCVFTSAIFGGDFHVGAAEVVITPPLGAALAGYYQNRAATGVHDDLHAKALVFENAGVKAAVISLDLIFIPQSIVAEARKLIEEQLGIPAKFVMISAIHTHTGPVLMTSPSRYNLQGRMQKICQEYTASLASKIANAAQQANAALEAATIRSSIGREPSLAFNRRYFMKDGTVGWNPGKLNPNILRPAGPVDPSVPVLYFQTVNGKPIASYVNYAVHSDTTGGNLISADYSYRLGKALKEAKGPDFISVFTIGCAGNVNHIDIGSSTPQSGTAEAARVGTILAAEVLRTMQHAPLVNVSSIRAESEIVKVPLPVFRPEEVTWARKTAATFGTSKPAPFIDLVRAAKIVEVADRHGVPFDGEVQVIALGDQVAFAGLPGEIFAETGLALKEDSPFPNTIIAELANGALGYIPNRAAYAEGAYEVVTSRCAAGSAELLADSASRQLFQLFQTH